MQQVASLNGLRCPHCGSEHITVTGVKGALGTAAATTLAFGAIGNLVAGKNAAVNTTTEPLQYKCTICKNKFESLPLCAPPDDILSEPCTVTFTRKSSIIGAAVPQILYLNGVKLGAVKNGKWLKFTTNNRYNVLFVTDQHGVAFKSEYRFEAQSDGEVSVCFKHGFYNTSAIPMEASLLAETPCVQISAPTSTETFGSASPPVRFCTNCGNSLGEGTLFCSACGEKRFVPQTLSNGITSDVRTTILQTKPQKAIGAFGLLTGAWLLILLFQGVLRGKLLFSADITFFIVAAMLGTSIYLLLQKDRKYKLYGVAGGLITVFLSAGTSMAVMLNSRMVGVFSLSYVLDFGETYYWNSFWRALVFVMLTMGISFGIWMLQKRKAEHFRLRFTAGLAAMVYALCSLVSWVIQYGFRMGMGQLPFSVLLSLLIGFTADALILYLSICCINSLCQSTKSRVELYGIGKVWAWIAAIAMFLSIGVVFATAFGGMGAIGYTASLLLAISGATGYILLLCKRRIGLAVIVSAAVLVLGGQFCGSLSALFYGNVRYVSLLIASVFGAVNPLFAWLAVRAADRRGFIHTATVAMPIVSQRVSGFHKFVSIFNITIGGLLIIPVTGNIIQNPEIAFLIIFMILLIAYLTFGIMAAVSQRSRTKLFPKWIKVVNIILFSIGVLLIAFALLGIIVNILN